MSSAEVPASASPIRTRSACFSDWASPTQVITCSANTLARYTRPSRLSERLSDLQCWRKLERGAFAAEILESTLTICRLGLWPGGWPRTRRSERLDPALSPSVYRRFRRAIECSGRVHGILGNCPVGRLAIGIATDICRYRSFGGRRRGHFGGTTVIHRDSVPRGMTISGAPVGNTNVPPRVPVRLPDDHTCAVL